VDDYIEIIQILSEAAQEAKWAPHPRVVLEVAAIKVCRRSTTPDIAGLVARIEKLEAMLAQKPVFVPPQSTEISTKMAETVPGKIVAVKEPPVTLTPPKPGAKTEAILQKPIIESSGAPASPEVNEYQLSETGGPVKDKKTPSRPKTDAPQSVGELWERILGDLLKNNKRAIHTCLSEGQLLSVNREQVVIGFQLSIYKERIEKDDYRGFLEKLVAHITGEPRQIKCCMVSEVKESEQTPSQAEDGKNNETIQNAVAMFGEEVVTIINK
jgi:DNA polymerase-3 subunit gamma/tau